MFRCTLILVTVLSLLTSRHVHALHFPQICAQVGGKMYRDYCYTLNKTYMAANESALSCNAMDHMGIMGRHVWVSLFHHSLMQIMQFNQHRHIKDITAAVGATNGVWVGLLFLALDYEPEYVYRDQKSSGLRLPDQDFGVLCALR